MSPLKIASAPFDNPAANIVIHSSDDTDFYIYKEVLILASPFFRDMFSLHQPSEKDTTVSEITKGGQPIVAVSEDKDTVDYLLRLCYPMIPPPSPTDFTHVFKVLEAALKYDVEKAVWVMKKELHELGASDPPRMFAIACRLRLEDEALSAAQMWRDQLPISSNGKVHLPFSSLVAKGYRLEMDTISAGSFRRFLLYVMSGTSVGPFCEPPPPIAGHSEAPQTPQNVDMSFSLGSAYQVAPDIILRSSNGVDIFAHQTILTMASPENTLLQHNLSSTDQVFKDGIPVVECPEETVTLLKLLQLCYPFGLDRLKDLVASAEKTSPTNGFEQDLSAYDAAAKYHFHADVKDAAAKRWAEHVSAKPLSVFFIATSLGRITEAQITARELVMQQSARMLTSQPLVLEDLYVENMEQDGSAKYYSRLIDYLEEHCTMQIKNGGECSTAFAIASVPALTVLEANQVFETSKPWGPVGVPIAPWGVGGKPRKRPWNEGETHEDFCLGSLPGNTPLEKVWNLVREGRKRKKYDIPLIDIKL